MTPEQYRMARQQRGKMTEVAAYLRVSRVTIARRESGKIAITHEATLALLSMPPIASQKVIQQKETQTEFAGGTLE